MKTFIGSILILALCAGTGCSFHTDYLRTTPTAKFTGAVSHHEGRAAVIFQEVIPGKPLPETVWKSLEMVWDPEHSRKIGFVQNYHNYGIPTTTESELIVPFGRIFADTLTSAMSNSFSACQVAYDARQAQALTNPPPDIQLNVAIDRFHVWEGPPNHLNFSLTCHYQVIDRVKTTSQEHHLLHQAGPLALGSIWHGGNYFAEQTEKQTVLFAEQAAEKIMQEAGF
jgi:hypothetical protein